MSTSALKTKRSKVVRIRDREATRAAILAAAGREFACNGFEAARTEEIAAQCGVAKGMIFHYFESKENLYRQVLDEIFAPFIASIQQFTTPSMDAREALEGVVCKIFDLAGQKPDVPAILLFETVHDRSAYNGRVGFPSLYHVLADILARGKRLGVFRKLDPWYSAINIVGACCFYFYAAQRLQPIWPDKRKPLSPAMIKHQAHEALEFVLAGIAA
jgi:AcrR family transcriptional regulator